MLEIMFATQAGLARAKGHHAHVTVVGYCYVNRIARLPSTGCQRVRQMLGLPALVVYLDSTPLLAGLPYGLPFRSALLGFLWSADAESPFSEAPLGFLSSSAAFCLRRYMLGMLGKFWACTYM